MALRSQEEITLAVAFSRTLRNVIALSASEDRRVWPGAAGVLEGTPAGATVPASLFRLLRFCILPELLGASAGPALYLAGKRASASLGLRSIQALREWFRDVGLGELEIELDQERVLVKLSHCASCTLLPPTGTPVCDVERGIVDGVLEDVLGARVVTKETLCWSLGDTVCQFEGYAGSEGYAYQENGFHPEAQLRLLTQLADQSEVALDNLRMIGERREHEVRDPLTGLLNFRRLRDHGEFELARAARYGRTVAVAMLDLDGFRAVNDEAGREGGDEVLCHWAAALTAQLRSCDLVCRYGGDEFVLLLPETSERQVGTALARILGATSRMAAMVDGGAVALTASAGVALFPQDGTSLEDLVAKAATTMYAARAEGPGRVAFFSSPSRS